jgi:acyl-CoA synthetase (AMP-forming)/AMP-acid ligase II
MHLIDLFDWGARNFPERLAFSGAGGELTYREAQAATNQIARALLAAGARDGTRFAGLSPNCTQIELATLGAMRAGGAFCNINLRAGVEANVDILQRGACEVLFFHSSVADQIPAFVDAIPSSRTSSSAARRSSWTSPRSTRSSS